MNLPQIESLFEQNDLFWSLIGSMFGPIGAKGNMDEFYAVSRGLNFFIEETQRAIALRN